MKAPSTKAAVGRPARRTTRRPHSSGAFNIKTIVVPIDLSPASGQAVAVGKVLAKQTGARLVLLNVVGEIRHLKDFGYGPVDWPHEDGRALRRNRRKLEGFRCEAGDECILCAADVRSGDPAAEIARAAVALDADLIVMATHHLIAPPNEGHPLPSVAEAVLRLARRPVLLLPVPARATPRVR